MKLKLRLTAFTVFLVVLVVSTTTVTTIAALKFLLRREVESNHITLFQNFRQACQDALYLGDDLAIQATSESIEKSVPGISFAVFSDSSRTGVFIGGIESLERFKKFNPGCSAAADSIGAPAVSEIEHNGNSARVYCLPISLNNIRGEPMKGTVYLAFNLTYLTMELNGVLERLVRSILGVMLVVLFLGLMIALFLASRITRPIQHLTDGAKAIGEGHLDTRIPIESTDELGFLAMEFNLMAQKLKELDNLKDDFVSSVSHELRSPLAAISGYVEMLRSKPLSEMNPDRREKALQIIAESTQRLTHFINDILDLAKLKSGHFNIRKKIFEIRELLEEIQGLYTPLFEKKQIQCLIDVAPSLREISGDEEKIRQVVINLVSNALKFTPSQGRITIGAKNQGEFVQIFVQDTGPGIPEDARDLIFERFRQLPQNVPDGQMIKGTGLGLAIAKGIIESHGGRIWVESEVGRGAVFNFTLPLES